MSDSCVYVHKLISVTASIFLLAQNAIIAELHLPSIDFNITVCVEHLHFTIVNVSTFIYPDKKHAVLLYIYFKSPTSLEGDINGCTM